MPVATLHIPDHKLSLSSRTRTLAEYRAFVQNAHLGPYGGKMAVSGTGIFTLD